jgi:hypothetical protein
MTACFASRLYHLATSSYHHHFHGSVNLDTFPSNLKTPSENLVSTPINTPLQIPEDTYSLISNISQVTKNALCSLYATHIKANNSLEVKFTNAFALFYFSDFHLQF